MLVCTPARRGREADLSALAPEQLDGPAPRALTGDEARAEFDRRSRRLLGMSGVEFLRRWDAGELDADDDRVAELAFLSPLGR